MIYSLFLAVVVIQSSFNQMYWPFILGSSGVSCHQLLQQYRLHNSTMPGAACSYMSCSQTFHLPKQNNSPVGSQHREQDVTGSEHAKEIWARAASKPRLPFFSPGPCLSYALIYSVATLCCSRAKIMIIWTTLVLYWWASQQPSGSWAHLMSSCPRFNRVELSIELSLNSSSPTPQSSSLKRKKEKKRVWLSSYICFEKLS